MAMNIAPLVAGSLVALIGSLIFATVNGDSGEAEDQPAMPSEGDEVAVMETSEGQIVLMFFRDTAPRHVDNFKILSKQGFYDGTRFHRTITGFMIQGGDPNSKDLGKSSLWGTGGNADEEGREINIPAEFSDIQHVRGVLSMARSQNPDSASSQFFIMHADATQLDGQYSVFGRVVSGMDVVDKIATMASGNNGAVVPEKAVVITSVKIKTWPLKDD